MADTSTQRSKQQIEADLAAARARLAQNIQELVNEVHPKSIAQRRVDDLKTFARSEAEDAKAQFVDESGQLRVDRFVIIGGAVVGLVGCFLVLKGIARAAGKGK